MRNLAPAPPELQTIADDVCAHIDWQHAELAYAPFAAAYHTGDSFTALCGFIGHLRHRLTPRMGYSREYLHQLRAAVATAEVDAARQRWETALTRDLLFPYSGNTLAALGAETILVAATPELCQRSAALVLANRARWEDGYWGVTQSLCTLLSVLFPLDECADSDLIPFFGWLLTKAHVEWQEARTWDENLLGTSGHNWYAHAFWGFWMLGLFFPEFRGMARYQAFAADYLERELSLLFADDGFSKEGSPGYHEFALRSLLGIAHLAALNEICLPEAVHARLRMIVDAGWRLLAPDGDFPVFGDAVRDGVYQGFHGHDWPESHPCMLLRRRAARFSLPAAKYVSEVLQPAGTLPYGAILPDEGQNLLPAYHRLTACAPAEVDSCLPHSGYYVMRQAWTPHADYMAIVAGSLGARITSHKHADIFGFELYSRGRRILVDNWYGRLAMERENEDERLWRKSSAAHNVATVDGLDHVPVLDEWHFGATVTPTVDAWQTTPDYAYFSGVHEGYLRQPAQVSACRRKIFYLRGGYWILLDRFTPLTDVEHEYQLHFHLKTPSTLRQDGAVVTHGAGGNLLIYPIAGASGLPQLTPNPYPVPEYENPDHLCYTHRQHGNTLLATLLVPFLDDNVPSVSAALLDVSSDERILTPWEATGLDIVIDGQRHGYVDLHMQWNLPWTAGDYQGSQRLFHSW